MCFLDQKKVNYYTWEVLLTPRIYMGFPGGDSGKESACQCRKILQEEMQVPESGRSPGEGNGNPLQYSCLENPMGRGAWWATVHGPAKSYVTDYKGLHRFFWLIFTLTTKNTINQNSPPPSYMNLDSASSSSYFPKGVYTCQRYGSHYYLPAPKNEWLYWKWSWRDQVYLIMDLERLGKQLSNNHPAGWQM